MSKRDDLLVSIANTIQDYKGGGLATPQHVNKWIVQFDEAVQLEMLHEMDHVLKHTYVSLAHVATFLEGLHKTKKLTGENPCAFWRSANFLKIQARGNSQTEILELFDAVLKEKCDFGVEECGGESAEYVYLDDGIFGGMRVINDLSPWIVNKAPAEAKAHIITIVQHTRGQDYASYKVKEAATSAKKNIAFGWWAAINSEENDVLCPVTIPDDNAVQEYVAAMSPRLRTAGQVGDQRIFSSDEGRQLLEREFLKAGVRIRESSPYLKTNEYLRPLGNSTRKNPPDLGLGSLFVTFRNCPNSAPLALWARDSWYPLFPRTTNTETEFNQWLSSLKKGKEK